MILEIYVTKHDFPILPIMQFDETNIIPSNGDAIKQKKKQKLALHPQPYETTTTHSFM